MKLLQIDFDYRGPFGREMTAALRGLAGDIAATRGLRWKLWTENASTGEAGGIYAFDDEASARAYARMHTERLAGFGIDEVRAKLFDVNADLSAVTRGPV
jgi:Putative mono-oxygenase ydhR